MQDNHDPEDHQHHWRYLNGTLQPRKTHTVHSSSLLGLSTYDAFFIVVILSFVTAALVGIIIALACYCRLRSSTKDPNDTYFASEKSYGGGALKDDSSYDRKLAQSVQMFQYQHQKQQMLEMEKAKELLAAQSESGRASEEEDGDDRYVVYECPGLANTGEMEVRNPVYSESPMPRVIPFPLDPVPHRGGEKRDLQ